MRCPCMYEMYDMFAPCPFVSCMFLLVCHAIDPWGPGSRDHPTILHDSLTLTSFCIGISMSYRNRYVAVASFSDMLPWHHFRICCRGTIFVSPSWHPFRSTMVTKCFITCSCQHLHKNCIQLAYVIRIMITTIKMFKIVVCFNC